MAKLSTVARQKTERVILWGPPGLGKTHLIGQLAEEGFNIWYFDLENGAKTLFQLPPAAQERIEYIKLPDTTFNPISAKFFLAMAKVGGKMSFCEQHAVIGCPSCKREEKPFVNFDMTALTAKDVVVIESLNALQNSVMYSILKDSNRPPDTKPEWDDWRRQGQIIESICGFFQQCNTNVIMTSHPLDLFKDEKYQGTAPIGGSSTVSANVTKYFDHSVLIRQEGVKRVLHTNPTKMLKYQVKSRYPLDLSTLDKPSLMPLFTYGGAGLEPERRSLDAGNVVTEAPAEVTAAANTAASSIMNGGQQKLSASSLLAGLKKQ